MSRKTLVVFALLLSLVSAASYQPEVSAQVALAQRDPDVDFVYGVYDKLEDNFYDPSALKAPKLYNAALDGVSKKLKEKGVEFLPRKIRESARLDEVYGVFPEEMARAKKLTAGLKNLREHELAFAAAEAMLDAVDDSHTSFVPPELNQGFGSGTYVGIGTIVRRYEDFYYVERAIKDGPAERAGLQRFDRLLAIDGQPTPDDYKEVVSRLRGQKGTTVEVTVERKKKELKIKIIRGEVADISGEGEIIKERGHTYTYIKINSYDFFTTYYFRKYVEEGDAKGSEGIILDLRGNPGGLIMTLDAVLKQLLPKGTATYVLKDRNGFETRRSAGPGNITKPLVVLVDEYSYSASEITASALKESGRAKIVGKKSDGKVGVGMIHSLPHGSAMMVTVAEVYTVKMQPMERNGVDPDVPIELTKDNIIRGEDSQLAAAIQELEKMLGK